jgi:hypothetical protein
MGTLGVETMNSTAFSLSSSSNPKVDGNQITFGAVDFQPHPSTLTPVFASLDQEMDLTIGSLNFRVGSLGKTHLSDLTRVRKKTRIRGDIRIIGWLFQQGKFAGQLRGHEKYRGYN